MLADDALLVLYSATPHPPAVMTNQLSRFGVGFGRA